MTQIDEPLELPQSLQSQLFNYRRRVWAIKIAEAIAVAVFTGIVAFLCVFVLDRLADTPRLLRLASFAIAMGGCAVVPLSLHRWVWRRRRLEQLARLLGSKLPHLGDELLGVIELVDSENEQTRSRALCRAAIQQVAEYAGKQNLAEATPNSRHRIWAALAVVGVAAVISLAALCPLAASNAWARLLAPWANTPRYTFAAFEPLPDEIIVAHGEPFSLTVRLRSSSIWQPPQGQIQVGCQQSITASLHENSYTFDMPSQITDTWLYVRVGDARQSIRLKPLLRPELTSIVAEVDLPQYLGRADRLRKDVRGGSVSIVKGSQASFIATASRALSAGCVDGQSCELLSAELHCPEILVEEKREIEFCWEDEFSLKGKKPFTLRIDARDDEPPSLACEDLPRVKVVLDSEQLLFRVKSQDDFGVKHVGIEWHTPEDAIVDHPVKDDRIVAAGGCDQTTIDATATFTAKSLGIEPQPILLRAYTVDYFPNRPRVYSAASLLYVLDPEQHAIWLTEQLNRWHRRSLEVRDRELRLHEINKQLRDLPPDELNRPETRRQIEKQAAAERSNSRRLENLVGIGEDLIRQASRNPEFGVGHLERWAEMLQILKDIAANRMPSVADLLKQASQANHASANKQSPKGPAIVDIESTQQPTGKKEAKNPANKSSCSPSLRLPATTLTGSSAKKGNATPSTVDEKIEEAVKQQQDLLAEFEKILNELNNVLANLEGSTLVKRLKAASREQYRIAGFIGDQLGTIFGTLESSRTPAQKKTFSGLSDKEKRSSYNASLIMDDMQAYYQRRRFVRFKEVLQDMKTQDVIGGLRQLSDDMAGEPGLSIAQCEYWSDTMDRWAEDLVEATCCGQCPGSRSRSSLPPSIVLEVLHILEGEVNLREDTRIAQKAKAALSEKKYRNRAIKLSESQDVLKGRTKKVVERIRALPDAEQEFPREIKLLRAVARIMGETTEILARPETGPPAIGAETEIIELLLQSRRINPGGGGGGGSTPGGGGSGTTSDSALALLGIGANKKEVRADRATNQAVGETGRSLPEEFRAGLDEYFHRLENPEKR